MNTVMQPLSRQTLDKAKIAYSCRRVQFGNSMTVITGNIVPSSGDLVLARVDVLGQHRGIESKNGGRCNLFPGDQIIVCYGNRYAPDQFEAEVPQDLSPCSLVAAGGMASQVLSQHVSMKTPTAITPIGLIGDSEGKPVNLVDWALPAIDWNGVMPHIISVLGTSMNAGKTTSAAYLIRGLKSAGFKVGAAKITGTGAPKDANFLIDAGAHPVFDFTDAGYPSTYLLSTEQIETILSTLTHHLAASCVDVIVLEIADGLFQQETKALCLSHQFSKAVDGIIFAASDPMGAAFGANWLREHKLPIVGISGLFTNSPLAIREVEEAINLPVFTLNTLNSDYIANQIGLNPSIS